MVLKEVRGWKRLARQHTVHGSASTMAGATSREGGRRLLRLACGGQARERGCRRIVCGRAKRSGEAASREGVWRREGV